MHCVWSRWPAWSGSSCDRLQCTVPGSTSPTLSGISPAAIIAYFSGTCKPRRKFPPPFSAAFRLSLPQPYRPFCRWPMPPIFVGGFRQPSSQRRFCCWPPLLFPSADSSRLRRDFHRFPWGNEGAMEAAPPEAAPLLGRLCFLSVIDGVAPYQNLISDETAWIKAVSLVFLRSIAWHRAAAPVVCGSD